MLRTHLHWAGAFLLGALVASFYAALFLARLKGVALDVHGAGPLLVLVFAASALLRWCQIRALKRDLRFAFADSLPRAAHRKNRARPVAAVA